MEYRQLGASGLKVPALCLGTATFGGGNGNEFMAAWGNTQVNEARRMVDLCLEAGLNFFDTANIYSTGLAEEILGQAIEGRSGRVLVSTKATLAMGTGPYAAGSSRRQLISECEASLKRLAIDAIDVYHMHAFDAVTPVEETLRALDDLVTSGKVRYIACSNFSGWHLMKSLAASDKHGWSRYVAHQIYYSLVGREAEWELLPLGRDQGVGTIVWSPLAGGALSGKIRRNQPAPKDSRLGKTDFIPFDHEKLYTVVDVLDAIAQERDKSIPQVALNWLLSRPTVSTLVIGARNETQLQQNLGAVGWTLTPAEIARLDAASALPPVYPYWHQAMSPELNPPMFAKV
jgi:aryl-alcohol dehydrogenase-like predicted oxidoreductase